METSINNNGEIQEIDTGCRDLHTALLWSLPWATTEEQVFGFRGCDQCVDKEIMSQLVGCAIQHLQRQSNAAFTITQAQRRNVVRHVTSG